MSQNRTLYLHIGMNKTGSTSIQHTLFHLLSSNEFNYVKFHNDPNQSHSIIKMFGYRKNLMAGKSRKENMEIIKKMKEEFSSHLSSLNSPNVIISGEGIVTLSYENLQVFNEFLLNFFNEIKVVTYVRAPYSFINSAFQQRLKGGRKINSFEEYIHSLYPTYKDRFEKFEKVFGKENVSYWKFDPNSFPNKDVVLDFCQRLKCQLSRNQTTNTHLAGTQNRYEDGTVTLRVNDSLSKETIALLYALKTQSKNPLDSTIDFNLLNSDFKRKLYRAGNQKFTLSQKIITPILERYADDVFWMEKRLGDKLTENFVGKEDTVSSEQELLNESVKAALVLKEILKKLSYAINFEHCNTPQEVADIMSNAVHSTK